METKEKLENIIKKSDYYYYVNSDLNSANFPIPDKMETEGWKIITIDKFFSSQEALDKIKAEGCRPANVYELALWLESHRDEMKKGTLILALGQLWYDDGDRRVPYVGAYSGGVFEFGLGYFGSDWSGDDCLLCFCDTDLGTLDTSVQTSDTLTLESAIDICKKAGLTVTKVY